MSPAGPRRPRVALVGWRLGTEFERLIRDGHDEFDYVVVSMDLEEGLRPLVDWRPMPLPRRGSFRLGWIEFFGLGALRLARLDADLVHTVGPVPVVPNRVDLNTATFCHAAFDAATAGRPVKGSASRVGWRLGQRVTLALERWWFGRRVGTLVAISEGGATDLRRHYPAVDVALAPRGIDLTRFRPDPGRGRLVREELGAAPGDVVAVFVDQQYRPLKGLDVAVEALALAARAGDGPDALWVVGAGNEAQGPLAERLGVGDRVRFLGHRPDMEDVYRAADVFLLPTVYETFCRAAHEAAACGLPLVAPPVSGIRELVGSDEAGLLARRDPADTARALVEISRDPELRARLGAEARRRAAAFDEQAMAPRIMELHRSRLAAD